MITISLNFLSILFYSVSCRVPNMESHYHLYACLPTPSLRNFNAWLTNMNAGHHYIFASIMKNKLV